LQPASRERCLDLNAATIVELERLPGIGEVTARKIIAYREQNGPFRRPEDLIIIEGFSERKYRSIADFVCVK
jgi:competence protein ComEA